MTETKERGVSLCIYPITVQQWRALDDAAAAIGMGRSTMIREAVSNLLNKRDGDISDLYNYSASQKLSEYERQITSPRAFWVSREMADRIKNRCYLDRVQQSEFYLQALREYLSEHKINLKPPI